MPQFNIETGTFSMDDPLADLPTDTRVQLKRFVWIAFGCILAIEALVILVLMCVFQPGRPKRDGKTPVKTMVVLGSGGHTAEMLKLVHSLDKQLYCPRVYVTAATDALSGQKAVEAEKSFQPDGKPSDCQVFAIPRSREVGQSYLTSVFTTLRSLLTAARLVWMAAPEVLLVNGPGTCIPLCLAASVYRRLCLRYCDIVYVESIARVRSLSLSGRILYHLRLADVFLVQWEALQQKYPRTKFVDRLY